MNSDDKAIASPSHSVRRISTVLMFAAALAACSRAPAPAEKAPPPPVAQTSATTDADTGIGGNDVVGPFVAVSTTAMSITGDASYSRDNVSFMNGMLLHTTHVTTGAAFDAMNAQGDTYDSAAPGEDDRIVDVRHVDSQELDADSQGGLCGRGTTVSYVALVHEQPIRTLAVIAFSGAQAPDRGATNSTVCAVFSYASQ